ncbi:MAG: ParA family protein [Gammaproteobacteria bacterium]|nr:ParA family protein [Gammaproteobacteria bacterium]
MEIWTIANQKGGVGKTTTAVNLGGLLAESGHRVLIIDLDPHGSMTSYFGFDPDTIDESVYDLFHNDVHQQHSPLASLLCHTPVSGMDLLPACSALVSLDRQIANRDGMGLVLRNALKKYDNYYRHVLIDCPPTLGILMINALAACHKLIIPVQTEHLALKGLDRMLNTLKMIIMSGKHSLDYLVVPTMYDCRTRASRDALATLQQDYPDHLWQDYIPVDTRLRDCSRIGRAAHQVYPESRGVQAYTRLLQALLPVEHNITTVTEGLRCQNPAG